MGKHRRGSLAAGLLALCARLRTPDRWTVPCRDDRGHRTRLEVSVAGNGVLVTVSGRNSVVLRDLAVGRLRGALRDAAISAGLSTTDCPSRQADVPPTRVEVRRRVVWCPQTGPSGAVG